MLEIGPVITDQEWAEEWSDQLENLLLEIAGIFLRADLRRQAAAAGCWAGVAKERMAAC
ncbi:hypothetical protein [Acrocarpospora pleiomorpha]|nr:hypothetical protein [Acrocarpospora pleiomorpha]